MEEKRKSPENHWNYWTFGGEFGIRTQGTLLYTAFRVLHHRPLGQLSNQPYQYTIRFEEVQVLWYNFLYNLK